MASRLKKADSWILILTLVLVAVGVLMMFGVSPSWSRYVGAEGELSFFWAQARNAVIALIMFLAAYKWAPIDKLLKWSLVILVGALVLCVFPPLWGALGNPGDLAIYAGGAYRWINLGVMGFQPAEFLKLALIFYMASTLSAYKKQGMLDKWTVVVWFLVVVGGAGVVVAGLQKDLGTFLIVASIALVMLWMSGVSKKMFAAVVGAMLLVAVVLIAVAPHRMERILTFMGSEGGDTHHIDNAMVAIGTGGWFGRGIGNSVQATGYLPESLNDSMFAVMGETLGFLGVMVVLAIFFALIMKVFSYGSRLADNRYSLIAYGVFGWLGAHVIINIAAMTGLAPLTGIPLPFLSYGGTSIMMLGIALGMVMQLSRLAQRKEKS